MRTLIFNTQFSVMVFVSVDVLLCLFSFPRLASRFGVLLF